MFDLTAPRLPGVSYDGGDVLLFRVLLLTRRVRVSFWWGYCVEFVS
ncbi:MAG: hypothetical protein PHV54_00810 [Tolumonas sp.]|nr:hypothetical protein [Tolumonas sp.]